MMAIDDRGRAGRDIDRSRAGVSRVGLAARRAVSGRGPAAVARPRPAPPRAVDLLERQEVLDLLHTRIADQAPAQVHATLLDEGTDRCLPRTMYRILDASHEVKGRRDQVRRPHYAPLDLLATKINEVRMGRVFAQMFRSPTRSMAITVWGC